MKKLATEIHQKDVSLVQFKATPKELGSLVYILRKSRNNPEALERKLIKRKVREIQEAGEVDNFFFPGSIVVNLKKEDAFNVESFSELLKDELKTTLTNDIANLVGDDVKVINFQNYTEDISIENEQALENMLTDETNKVGYIVDGQHRLLGLLKSSKAESLELPVVGFLGTSDEKAFKNFTDINENQKVPTKVLTYHIRMEIGGFEDADREKAYKILYELVEDMKDSPLYQKIRIFEDDTGRWMSSSSLTKYIRREITGIGKALQDIDEDSCATILKNYFQAWKELYPEQWDKDKRTGYILTKAMGIQIMCKLFERAFRRVEKYEGGNTSVENFKNQLKPITDLEIPLDPKRASVPLDWDRDVFGTLSSGKGINYIVKQIKNQYSEHREEINT